MSAIIIRCKLDRPDNTPVEMADGTLYRFVKNADGASVCVVSDRDHQMRLLSIAEGYEFYAPADLAVPAWPDPKAPVAATVLLEPVGGTAPPSHPAPAAAGGEPVVPPTTDPATDTDTFSPAATLDMEALLAWAEQSPENTAALRQMHVTELGSEPRANAKSETIAAKLIAKRSA